MSTTNRFIGSTMLVAGTSIGAGMLALPVSTGPYGFLPSALLFVICWFFMMLTGLLILEVNLWLKPGANILSMASQTLGLGGRIIGWITYLLLFYSLLAAYAAGMGDLIRQALQNSFGWHMSNSAASLIFVAIVGIAIYCGAKTVDYVNRLFFTCKILTFLGIIIFLFPHVQLPQLSYVNPNKIWLTLTIVVTSFGYHNIVPSIRVYLNDDARKLRLAIIIGSTIPLFVYLLWQIAIVGVVPVSGKNGLLSILSTGQPATGLATSLSQLLATPWIATLFNLFTIFAITTSFTCVAFSLFDFLSDSFSIKRDFRGRILTLLLTFIPPLVFVFFYPGGFILALSYAGIFVAILLGILPALMTWSGRYTQKIANGYRSNIGKFGLILIILFSLIIIFSELLGKL